MRPALHPRRRCPGSIGGLHSWPLPSPTRKWILAPGFSSILFRVWPTTPRRSHSPYFGEELIRRPDFVLELNAPPEALIHGEPPPVLPAELRRWYRRGIF